MKLQTKAKLELLLSGIVKRSFCCSSSIFLLVSDMKTAEYYATILVVYCNLYNAKEEKQYFHLLESEVSKHLKTTRKLIQKERSKLSHIPPNLLWIILYLPIISSSSPEVKSGQRVGVKNISA